MKSLVMTRDTWHYKVATKFGPHDSYDSNGTFCEYFWGVMGGLMKLAIAAIAAIIAGIAILVPTGDLVAWSVVFMQYGTSVHVHDWVEQIADIYVVALVDCLVIAVVLVWMILEGRYQEYKHLKAKRSQDCPEMKTSFLRAAYTKLREKTCVRLKFIDS